MSREVRLDVCEGIGTLTLCRPARRNSFDLPAAECFRDAVAEAGARDDIAVLLLTGEGRTFCAGGDVHAMAQAADPVEWVRTVANTVHEGIAQLDAFRLPVVAAVQGAAAGAGLALALVADLVLTTPDAVFAAAYSRIGLTPDGGATWLLPRSVGQQRALSMLLEDRRLTGTEAVGWGIATRTVEPRRLLAEALRTAQRVADGPAAALGQTRALVRSSWNAALPAHLDAEAAAISEARRGSDQYLDAVRQFWRGSASPG